MINDVLDFIYPRYCFGCRNVLLSDEKKLCLTCRLNLPRTRFGGRATNPMFRFLRSQHAIQFASASFFFEKNGCTQQVLHALKYHHQPQLGILMGTLMAQELEGIRKYDEVTWIPVPIHPQKRRIRGYNQSELLARGLCRELGGKVLGSALNCMAQSQSQTHKHRSERWTSNQSRFGIEHATDLIGQQVIIVDDVFTTGATISGLLNVMSELELDSLGCVTFGYSIY